MRRTAILPLDQVVRQIVAEELAKLLSAQPADPNEWIDQASSPLGRRGHLEAVRRKVLAGRRVGKRVLVRRADIDRYVLEHPDATVPLNGPPPPKRPRKDAANDDGPAEMLRLIARRAAR